MQLNRWIDRSQPQTLMMATIIMYINAGLGLLTLLFFGASLLGVVLVFGQLAAGLGIANEKKWGYWLGVGLVSVAVAWLVFYFSAGAVISLLFYGALLALLLHPQSRQYRRTWFR